MTSIKVKKEEGNKKMTKFELDNEKIEELITKYNEVEAEEEKHIIRIKALAVYQVPYHGSGKIEGLQSMDSTSECGFCKAMQEHAKEDSDCICGLCYAAAEGKYRTNVSRRHGLQAKIMSGFDFTEEELAMLPIHTQAVRFDEDGDLTGAVMAVNYFRTCKAFPDVKFALWCKNAAAAMAAYRQEGKPKNLTLIYSDPKINGTKGLVIDMTVFDHVFTVYEKSNIKAAIESGSNECNGKKCMQCGYKCYMGGWKAGTNIAELLRGKKAKK